METIFSEARKYKLHLIVGTQSITQLPVSLKSMVINNTAIKLVGINGLMALQAQAQDLGVPINVLKFLPPYYFYHKQDHFPAKKIKSPDFLLRYSTRYFLSKNEQQNLKEKLLANSPLYRDKNNDSDSTTSQNKSESTDNFKPKFTL